MAKGLVVAILSILFYLSNLLGGGQGPVRTADPPSEQQSYVVLGQTAYITAEKAIVRRGPHSGDTPVGTVAKGAAVTILDQKGNWRRIRYAPGADGWIPSYVLEFTETPQRGQDQIVLAHFPADPPAIESLLENGGSLTGIAPWGWHLDSYGNLSTSFQPEVLGKHLYFAGNQKLKTYALVRLDASPVKLLENEYLQEKTAREILESIKEWGLKGVYLDLNYIPREEEKLGNFLKNLKALLDPEGFQTLLALPMEGLSGKSGSALSSAADYLIVKTGGKPERDGPGPLASYPVIKESLKDILKRIPGEKLILGLRPGGFDWARMGAPAELSYQEIMQLAARRGASVKWDAESRSPYFQYGTGHEVWFENRYSLKHKLDLIHDFGLAGIAFLRLGQEDPEIWNTISTSFNQPIAR
ncbi:MAG: SH3 domain-containing protein [Firmicutes bacterium]|nr:SH3 domain-containing protein [Bacillota bacterium]